MFYDRNARKIGLILLHPTWTETEVEAVLDRMEAADRRPPPDDRPKVWNPLNWLDEQVEALLRGHLRGEVL